MKEMTAKTFKGIILTLAISALTAFSTLSALAVSPYIYTPVDEKEVVYVSTTGNVNESKGVREFTSVSEAVKAVSDGGYVVILEDIDMDGEDFGAHSSMITIRGRDDGERVTLTNRHMRKSGGPLTFECINLCWKKKSDADNDMSILTEGHELIIGKDVQSVGDEIALTGNRITVNSGKFIIRFATWGAKASFDEAVINIGGGTVSRICPTWTGPDSTNTTINKDITVNISGGTLEKPSLVNNRTLAVKGNITFNITGGTVLGKMACVEGGNVSVGGIKRLIAEDYGGTIEYDKGAFDTVKANGEAFISDREPKPLEPEMSAVTYYRENPQGGFIYELRPENGTEIPFGTMRYETQKGYYPLGKNGAYERPEIYPWGTASMAIEGDFYKFVPTSAKDISLTFDTSPQSYYWSYSQPYFTFAVKTSRAFSGHITFKTLDSRYRKEFPVDFTGEWQKVILDLSDVSGWTEKDVDGNYIPSTQTPFSPEVNALFGGHNITLAGNGKTDYYMFDYMALFESLDKAKAFKGIAEAVDVDFSKSKPTLKNPVGSKYFLGGYPDNTFKPNAGMTRAEACTVVARLLASEAEIAKARSTKITDIKKDDWYYGYITYLEELGYIDAIIGKDGDFRPNDAVTRAEFVKLVHDAKGFETKPSKDSFSDVPAGAPFAEAIYSAAASGAVNGYPDGTFKPENTLTRAEIATVLSRIIGIEATTGGHKFDDLDSTHWAYGVIMATVKQNEPTPDFEKGAAKLSEVDALSAALKKKIIESPAEVSVKGTKYYVSQSGNDENDGKSPETAWKTLSKVSSFEFAKGDGVFLRRGDIFRERLILKNGVTYSAYGDNAMAKPQIWGSPKSGAVASDWELFDEANKIWRYKEKVLDQGSLYLDGTLAVKQIPSYRLGFGFVNKKGERYNPATELTNNLDMFCETTELLGGNGYPQREKSAGYLYLKCDKGNPGEVFDTVEFLPTFHLARPSASAYYLEDVTIDNIAFRYVGAHALHATYGNNYTVQNCTFEYIGGGVQGYNLSSKNGEATRFGNAVEVGWANGHTVRNCYINEVYDAGLTFQHGSGSQDVRVLNVLYEGNLIENCNYSIEYFTGSPKTAGFDAYIENFVIRGNIFRTSGFGFCTQRPNKGNSAHLMGWNHYNVVKDKSFIIENNIFDRGYDMLVRTGVGSKEHLDSLPIYKNNTYIQFTSGGKYPSSFGIYSNEQVRIPYNLELAKYLEVKGILDGENIYYVR